MDCHRVGKELAAILAGFDAPVHYSVLILLLAQELPEAGAQLDGLAMQALGKLLTYGYVVKTGDNFYSLSYHYRLVRVTVEGWRNGAPEELPNCKEQA